MRAHLAPTSAVPLAPGPVPSFSVIVAAYQAADTIGAAVESALAQTLAPLEVIVCDDGSSDDLEGALAPYRERITLLRQENRGAAAARNAAIRAARGDFVAILDADDVYLPERLEALGELAAARPDLDILTTDTWFEVGGELAGRFNDERHPFATADQRTEILRRSFILDNAAVRRARLLEVGGFDEGLAQAEDWELWIRLILGGSLAGSVDEPLARYRIAPDSLTSARVRSLALRVEALERAAAHAKLSEHERRVLARSIAEHRARADLAGAEDALAAGRPDARRRALAVARDRAHRPLTRAKAAVAALAPGVSRRLLTRRGESDRLRRPLERRSAGEPGGEARGRAAAR